jgi:hypothetical protein
MLQPNGAASLPPIGISDRAFFQESLPARGVNLFAGFWAVGLSFAASSVLVLARQGGPTPCGVSALSKSMAWGGTRPRGTGDPPVQRFGRLGGLEITSEARPELLLHLVGPPDPAAALFHRLQLGRLGVSEVGPVLRQGPGRSFEVLGSAHRRVGVGASTGPGAPRSMASPPTFLNGGADPGKRWPGETCPSAVTELR